MSPTSPTLSALHRRLKNAHSKIRELEARQAELLARLGTVSDDSDDRDDCVTAGASRAADHNA